MFFARSSSFIDQIGPSLNTILILPVKSSRQSLSEKILGLDRPMYNDPNVLISLYVLTRYIHAINFFLTNLKYLLLCGKHLYKREGQART